MDSIFQLRAAFAKVIVSYRNKKLSSEQRVHDLDAFVGAADAVGAIEQCKNEVIIQEKSKATHLELFFKVFSILDTLSKQHLPKDEADRGALKIELITVLHALYKLNHEGNACNITFSGIPYKLSTTLSYGGWSYGLTDLGNSIRDYLLVPLGASGVAADLALKNINAKVADIFANLAREEVKEQNLQAMRDRITAQETELQQLRSQQKAASVDEKKVQPIKRSVSPTLGQGMFDKSVAEAEQLANVASEAVETQRKGGGLFSGWSWR